jgi:hypothetical protein
MSIMTASLWSTRDRLKHRYLFIGPGLERPRDVIQQIRSLRVVHVAGDAQRLNSADEQAKLAQVGCNDWLGVIV